MEISLFETLQHIEVVALDIEVLGIVEINALFTTRAKSGIDGGVGKENRLALVWPSKLIALRTFRHDAVGKVLLQLLEIYQMLELTGTFVHGLRYAVWKQLRNLHNVVLDTITTLHS